MSSTIHPQSSQMMLKPVSFIIEPNINSSFSKTACRSMKMRSGFFYDFLVLFVGASLCGTMLTSRSWSIEAFIHYKGICEELVVVPKGAFSSQRCFTYGAQYHVIFIFKFSPETEKTHIQPKSGPCMGLYLCRVEFSFRMKLSLKK